MKRLYHISFDANLAGVWQPQAPRQSGLESADISLSEPSVARICVSDRLLGCFAGIYPNIYREYNRRKHNQIVMTAYEAVLTPDSVILTPEELVKLNYVHDAIVTGEHCILTPTMMRKRYTVEYRWRDADTWIMYRPYERTDLKEVTHSPIPKMTILKTF